MRIFILIFLCVQGLCLTPCKGLILVGSGNTPVTDPGWPEGAAGVANAANRLGWWEGPPFGGGEWHFEFNGDTSDFQKAVNALALIKGIPPEIRIQDGMGSSFADHGPTNKQEVAWTFTVWVTKNWEHLYGNTANVVTTDDPNAGKSMPAPRIDLFLHSASRVDFGKIVLPANIVIHDERAITAGVDISKGTVVQARIVDAYSNQQLSGAKLIATSGNAQYQYTNIFQEVMVTNGVARLKPLPPGYYQISATAPGYVESAADYGDYSQPSFKKYELKLAPAGAVTGVLMDEDGKPCPHVHLVVANTLLTNNAPYRALKKESIDTDDFGRFSMTNLPIGTAQIWLQSPLYFQDNLFAYHSVPAKDIRILVHHTGSLTVKVLNKSKAPVQMVDGRKLQVSVHPKGGDVRGSWGGGADLNADGTYSFIGVHPGEYRVSIDSSGAAPKVIQVDREKTAELIFELP
ncbi:MAG: hypothetical protein JWN25_2427 [Verrucomicrobiales bacterium]|nr:hypothetical protein [Verrucomicrobiales bacterium]